MIDLDALLKRALHARNEQLEMGMRPAQVLDLIHLARAAADSLPKIKEGSPAPADTRQQFEAWARKADPGYHLDWNGSARRAQRYYVDRTQHAYEGFCAALALSGAAPASQAAAPHHDLPKGWLETLERLNFETLGEYAQDTASAARDCCVNALQDLESELAGAAPVEAASPWQRFSYPTKPGVYLVALDPGLHGLRTDRAMEAQYGELTAGWTVRECGVVVHVTGYVKAWMELPPIPAAPAPEAQ